MEFVDTPLAEIVGYLGDFHNVDIRLDAAALEERGVTPESPLSVRFQKVPLGLSLRLALQQFGLSYTIYDGKLLLTTPDRARRGMPTVRYPLDRFIQDGQEGLAPEQVDTLTTAIRTCIDPGGWGDAEEQASLIGLPRSRPRSLMVTAPLAAQMEIAAVMHDLEGLADSETPDASAAQAMSGVRKSLIGRAYRLTGSAEALIERITASVEPASWRSAGGQGDVAAVELGPVRALVVRQTLENQRRIEELLEQPHR